MKCLHNTKNYTYRTFSNKTQHICIQCADCGAIIRDGNKLWLKPEDIPQEADVIEFNEKLYAGEQPAMF